MNLSIANKILIIRFSSLGDVLLTTPVIRSIKKQYPDIQIDFLVKSQYKDVLVHNPHLNRLFIFEKESVKKNILIRELKEPGYDLIIDLQNNFRSASIAKKLNKVRLKFNKRTKDKLMLVRFKVNKLKDAPQIPDRYAKAINDLQLDNEGLELVTKKEPDKILDKKENIVALCPGSRHFSKMYPEDYFISLGKRLNESSFNVILLGGKSDKEICSEISKRISSSIDLSNDDDLLQTAANMKMCKAVISNDSGLMHLACAVKTPVLAIFGSTVKEFGFTPYKNKNLILENNSLSCRPCSHIGKDHCPKGHFKCMLDINPEQAFNGLLQLLNTE